METTLVIGREMKLVGYFLVGVVGYCSIGSYPSGVIGYPSSKSTGFPIETFGNDSSGETFRNDQRKKW